MNEKTYEIDLGNVIVEIVHKFWLRLATSYGVPIPPDEYKASVTYNDFKYEGTGSTETEALQNLTAKIKLAKELK